MSRRFTYVTTRSAQLPLLLWWMLLGLLTVCTPSFASTKAKVVIVAIDDSGSMVQSDRNGTRLEATSMLALSGDSGDQLGIVRFGSDADWILKPGQIPSPSTLAATLKGGFHSSDRWTNFAVALHLIDQYLEDNSSLFKNYDVNVVLMTDGAADPGPQYPGGATQNLRESIEIAGNLGKKGTHLYTIGLGGAVQSDFLTQLASEARGTYSPARTGGDLQFAFLKIVTHIFSLPAYRLIQSAPAATIDTGGKPELIRAYLFRENSASSLDLATPPFFAGDHIAAYDLPLQTQTVITLKGPSVGASVVVCVRQPLSFADDHPLASVALADSKQEIRVRLLGGGEPLWDRYFMHDATVQIRLHPVNGPDVIGPLYPDPSTETYHGLIPTNEIGDYQASISLTSDYGAVDYFLTKFKIAATAVDLPLQSTIEYPSFLPASTRHFFGTNLSMDYVLPIGSAKLVFNPPPGIRLSATSFDIGPGQHDTATVSAGDGEAPRTLAIPYTVTWNTGVQEVTRSGMVDVYVVPQDPIQFARRHWTIVSAVVLLALIALIVVPAPRLKGVLLVESPGIPKRSIQLARLRTKRLTVAESVDREVLDSNPILIRTGTERQLFNMHMVKSRGSLLPRITVFPGVPIQASTVLKHGSKITLKDREMTFTYYAG